MLPRYANLWYLSILTPRFWISHNRSSMKIDIDKAHFPHP